jgi:hypothetical protein
MGISQVLQGCGQWQLTWKHRLPASVRGAIGDGSTLVVFESDVTRPVDGLRTSALFEGVLTELSTSGATGWEASWFMMKPNGDGPVAGSSGSSGFQDYFFDSVDGINGLTYDTASGYNGLWSGTWGPAAGPDTATPPTVTVRERADSIVAIATEYKRRFGSGEIFGWKISPGLVVTADYITSNFRNNEVIFTDGMPGGLGADGLLGVPANIEVGRGIDNIISDAVGYADRNATTGAIETDTTSNTVPFKAPDGTTLDIRRLLDVGGNQNNLEEETQRAADNGLAPRVTVDVSLKGDPWLKDVDPGDAVYVYSPDEPDLFDDGNSVNHFGVIHPKSLYVSGVTRNVTDGMSVWFRNPVSGGADAVWVDVTEYVQTSVAPASVSLMDRFEPAYRKDAMNAKGPRRVGAAPKVAERFYRSVN